jgi:hypothetical protein
MRAVNPQLQAQLAEAEEAQRSQLAEAEEAQRSVFIRQYY